MTQIAVTGAAGLVGGNLIRALLVDGIDVRALVHHDKRALAGLDLEPISVDLGDLNALVRAFEGCEVVYHLASLISLRMDSWDEVVRVNFEGTRNVIQACLKNGVRRLVYFSSIHTLQQEPFDRPIDENRPYITDPNSPPYERSKVIAEREILESILQGLDAIVIIPTAIVGPYDFRPSYFGQALKLLARGRIPALVRGGYDWVDVRDVIHGARQAERLAPCGSRYILSGHWHSVREVAQMTAQITGKSAPRLTVPLWLAHLAEPLMARLARINGERPLYNRAMLTALRSNRQMSHARAASELGYTVRPCKETLRDTLSWFKEQDRQP